MAEIDRRKAALIAELEVSRGEIRAAGLGCEENLNVVSLMRKTVGKNLLYWIPGATLAGFAISRLLILRIKTKAHAPRETAPQHFWGSLTSGAVRLGWEFARPAFTQWLSSQFKDRTVSAFFPEKNPPKAEQPRMVNQR